MIKRITGNALASQPRPIKKPRRRRARPSSGFWDEVQVAHDAIFGIITVHVKVIIPDALVWMFGHSTDMDLEDVARADRKRLAALGLSAHGASLAARKPDAIRNFKNGQLRVGD